MRCTFAAIMLFLAATPSLAQPPDCREFLTQSSAPVEVLGAFTNMRYTDEHAYGYTVELWQIGGCVFGLFSASAGLSGDTPAGLLEEIGYDRESGGLSFRARLTLGLTLDRKRRPGPSRDLFAFTGTLRGDVLKGTLETSSASNPERRAVRESVVMRRSAEESAAMPGAKSYAEWETGARDILRFRGPRW